MAGESDVIFIVDLRQERDIVAVRQHTREIAGHMGFDQHDQTRISTAASEIARNAFTYAGGGKVEFGSHRFDSERQSLVITITDQGPGITDLDTILDGHFRSKTGLGKGILGAKKLMDRFDIQTGPGQGTKVTLERFLPVGSPPVMPSTVEKIATDVAANTRNPFLEVQHQNQELMRALQEVQTREAELARLHAILQRESDEAIRIREARLQAIISAAMNAIVSIDEQQQILVFNAAAEKLFLCPASQAMGSSFDRFTPTRFKNLILEYMREMQLSGTVARPMSSQEPLTARRLNGEEFPIEATISQVQVAGQKLFTIVLMDITERKRAESLEQQLRQAQKMEALGRLAGGVAHDFNTLLNVMLGYSELLIAELPAGDPRRTRVQQIEKSAHTGALLTRQLLAFSRKQPIAPQAIDLTQVLRDLEPMLSRLVRQDIELEIHYQGEEIPVKVDPGQIQQVILNLTANARDAMPSGGNVTIELRMVELDEAYTSRRNALVPGKYAMLAVSDNGTGMDSKTVDHIFEPFFTTKDSGKGTGLGLATVSGIVQQNGGDILVYSEPGVGSIFKVYLPRSTEPIKTADRRPETPGKLSGNETILLVEDSAPLRHLTREILTREGYSVIEAVDGVQALELSAKHADPIHLLITDIVMPKMRGTEVAEMIANQRTDIGIILMSGYTEEAISKLIDSRRISILEKPYTSAMLLRTVRQKLDEASRTTELNKSQ